MSVPIHFSSIATSLICLCRRVGRGRSTTVAVFMHEVRRLCSPTLGECHASSSPPCGVAHSWQVPHNIADFALLVGQGMRTTNALKLQFITALGAISPPNVITVQQY